MARFPFFREMAGECALVVGGGEVALRRARMLAEFGADVTVVATEFCAGFGQMPMKLIHRAFEMSDLNGAAIVVAATDDRELNARIGSECRRRGTEINVSDDPAACTFQFPGIVRRGTLTVGISTNGASPAAVRFVRERIEAAIPEKFEEVLICMEEARELAKDMIDEQKIRSKVLKKVFACCLENETRPDRQEIENLILRFRYTEMD